MKSVWKKAAAAVLAGGLIATIGMQSGERAQAASSVMVPGYEVKLLLSPAAALGSDGKPSPALASAFGLGSAQSIGVEYFDTGSLDLNSKGWDVRFRKKADKSNFEISYKKRYPIVNGNINAALEQARLEGFTSSDDNYEAEIDWNYSKQTLSISTEKKKSASGYSGTALPAESKALGMAVDEIPGKLENWSASGWGKGKLSAARAHGPVAVSKYTGAFDGLETDLEIWPIRSASGTGTETIVEVSFKTDDAGEAAAERDKLIAFVQGKGWLVPQDSLKTQLILERY
ncbi:MULTISPECIES: hypothetical protein [Paenibacillus]|uniref:hypothetical protein n=1 Tax=Paenibacillus TaxID=44249 RepID=UPI0003901264|nr:MULTISPECIES: hypothetical protein [Paenibacillus]KKC49123.1 hypothetical protein VE23_21835 [Paenibacillus sp. D9]CDN45882.1 Conserved domain protein [Paenibacillus sp. P22]